MKKSTRIILMTSICLISVGIVFSTIGFFTGASPSSIILNGLWNWGFTYQNGGNYDNDFEENNTYHISDEAIDSLDIDWISGNVSVVPYDGDDIIIREKSRSKIDDENCLRYRINGSTLEIYYLKEARINLSGSSFNYSKQLQVKIPRRMAEDMDELNLDAVSSDLSVRDMKISTVDVDTTSGNFVAKDTAIRSMEMNTVSGDMRLQLTNCPKELDFDSTSGDCLLTLPKGSNVTAEFDTVSGDFSTDFSTRFDADEYIIGNGKNEFSVGTVSGDFIINKAVK